jgi:hypothetical protein
MSVVRRHTPEEVAAWEARGPEPFVVAELPGWTRQESVGARDRLLPNERFVRLVRGPVQVGIMRGWDAPLQPGGPMKTSRSRPVVIDGRSFELFTTSMFEGAQHEVQVTYVTERGWSARIVFENASAADVDAVLGAIRFST